ncbi:MAG: putative membrane protein [Halioglobus sp.]|jgi:putative membrane protein
MLWLKAFHIIFVVCWFAGLFYLPRILVNFAMAEHPETRTHLALMAHKLYRFVTPLMVLALVFGLLLVGSNPDYYISQPWMWGKLAGVGFLLAYHIQCGRYVTLINSDKNTHGHVFYRFFNEVPVFFLFLIVILVVVKPG